MMFITLTLAKEGLFGSANEEIEINPCLISSLSSSGESGTWILMPPYQKAVKVRETIEQIKSLCENMNAS